MIAQAARRDRGARRALSRARASRRAGSARASSSPRAARASRASGSSRSPAPARSARSALALITPALSLGPAFGRQSLKWTPWRRGRRLVDEVGQAARRGRHRRRDVLHRVPGGSGPRADRLAARRRACADGRPDDTARVGAGRHRRVLEDLHARGLRDLAVPQADVRCDRSRGPRSSARATTRPSTRRQGGKVLFGPAGRPLPQLPLTVDRHGHLRAAGHVRRRRSARPGGASAREGPQRDPRQLVRFVDERTGGAPFLRKALRYVFPDHWSFLLGEVALYSFILLVATGIYLTFFFDDSVAQTTYHGPYAPLDGATMSHAYASVLHISFSVKAGLLIRQTHHWAANVFVAAIVLHLLRVFFTGAFRKPRDLTYLIGLSMLGLALLEGYLGYSLVDDLLSGMGLAIGYSVALSIPFVGGNLGSLLWDGPFPGSASFWPRMYIAHVLVIPVLIGALLTLHLVLVASRHHTQFKRSSRRDGAPRRRRADVPRPGAAVARADVRDVRRPLPARRARADQPGLAVGPVPRRRRNERRATGLVPRLADRGAAARAELRRRDRRLHGRTEPVLGRAALPRRRVRGAGVVARVRTPLRRRPRLPQPARAPAGQPDAARGSAPHCSSGSSWCSSQDPPTVSTSGSASRTAPRSGRTASSSWWLLWPRSS